MVQMAPIWFYSLASSIPVKREVLNDAAARALRFQWRNPADILSVLLLLGPEIVKKAVAAQTGRRITPVAFSFGWVAYGASALLDALGGGTLMPAPDVDGVMVVGADSTHLRNSSSWVLGRLLRDLTYKVDEEMHHEQQHVTNPEASNEKSPQMKSPQMKGGPAWEALRVSVYTVDSEPKAAHGVPSLDLVWYSGCVVILIQLVVSMVPWIAYRDWSIFLVTAAGTLLAVVGSSLPQWRQEKWACPSDGGATVAITQGNGSRHVVLIENNRQSKVGLDLEILARATRVFKPTLETRTITVVLTLLWVMLLITVSGMEEHTWYLLAIGLVGSVQNLYAAGVSRSPSAHGIHITHKETIRDRRVHPVIKKVEKDYPSMGLVLLDIFYPGSLRVNTDEDKDFWREAVQNRMKPNKFGVRVDTLGAKP